MKAKREHRVPLSGRVLAVLAEAWMLTDESGLVFPNAKGRQLTRGALGRVLRRCGIDGTTHGFRSSFRDYCACLCPATSAALISSTASIASRPITSMI